MKLSKCALDSLAPLALAASRRSKGAMSGDDIVYSSVSKGSVVLSCHTDKTGNFLNVVQRILEKLPPADNTVTYKYGR